MATLVLKSTNALDANVESLDFTAYKQRVLADGGVIADETALKEALNFALTNKLSESEVYSATSARWGVKLDSAGKPKKLYSLFSSAGDIDVTIGSANAIFYNTTSFAFPVIELRSSFINSLKTSVAVNNVRNSGVFVIAKAPVLASGTSYGTSDIFALGELSNLTNAASGGDSASRRMNTLYYKRTSNAEIANVWRYLAYGYGTQGSIETTAGELSDATVWNKSATFLKAGLMELINNGTVVKTDTTVIESSYINDLYFNIGRSRSAAIGNLDWASPLYASVVESWCLVNTTSEKMKALSTRSNLY